MRSTTYVLIICFGSSLNLPVPDNSADLQNIYFGEEKGKSEVYFNCKYFGLNKALQMTQVCDKNSYNAHIYQNGCPKI